MDAGSQLRTYDRKLCTSLNISNLCLNHPLDCNSSSKMLSKSAGYSLILNHLIIGFSDQVLNFILKLISLRQRIGVHSLPFAYL